MANYYGNGRSNYFRVKDMAKFREWLDSMGGLDVSTRDMVSKEAMEAKLKEATPETEVCLLAETEDGDYPNWIYDEDGDEEEVDFLAGIAEHLVPEDGNIFIWQHVGNEKLRYLSGYAIAVNHKNEHVHVGIRDIYKLAAAKFDVAEEDVSTCEY